jgi:hypothetical protein
VQPNGELRDRVHRSLADQTHRANRSRKEVLSYPLTRRFRQRLCRVV